jgi:hypothetical protein
MDRFLSIKFSLAKKSTNMLLHQLNNLGLLPKKEGGKLSGLFLFSEGIEAS